MRRVRSAAGPTPDAVDETTSQPAMLAALLELWSLLDAASRSYGERARAVSPPARLLLWSLAHRRERHAARLLQVLQRPEWAGNRIGTTDPAAVFARHRARPEADEPAFADASEALQRTAETETLVARRCARLIAIAPHTLVERVLRWQLADTRFAQHQIEVLLGMLATT